MFAFAGLPVPHGRALVRKFSLVIATFSVPRVIEPPEMTFGDSSVPITLAVVTALFDPTTPTSMNAVEPDGAVMSHAAVQPFTVIVA